MKMVECQSCGALWPVPELTKCDNCGAGPAQLEKVDVESSVEAIFKAYGGDGRSPGVVRTTDVYPLILEDLCRALEGKLEFVLYGSAALWLEGKSRPDRTEFQQIKDLDMCCPVSSDDEEAVERLMDLVRGTTAGAFIPFGNRLCVELTKGGTLEFKTRDHLIQFSFALKGEKDYREIAKLAAPVRLPTRSGTRLRCAGLRFISAGLLVETGLFHTTLFRSDKTEKILVYACICVGYETVRARDVLECLVLHIAGASWAMKKAYVSNVGVDRNTKRRTKYFMDVEPLRAKLDGTETFRKDSTQRIPKDTFNKIIESNLVSILAYISKARPSKEQRAALQSKYLRKEGFDSLEQARRGLTKSAYQDLMQKIQREIAIETDEASIDLAYRLTIDDAVAIWESEVGTGMLIFLTEQLVKVRSTISECRWITSEHRDTILEGHRQILDAVLEVLDERLELQSQNAVKVPLESTVSEKAPLEVTRSTPAKALLGPSSGERTSSPGGSVNGSARGHASVEPRPSGPYSSREAVELYVMWNTTGTIVDHLQRAYGRERLAPFDGPGLGLDCNPSVAPPQPEHKGQWNAKIVNVIMSLIAQYGVPDGSGLKHYLENEARRL